MPNTQNNTTPNSNNLFDIFKAQVESISALNDVIIKAKIGKKVGKRIDETTQVVLTATKSIYATLEEISKQNPSQLQQASKVMDSLFGSLGKVFDVIQALAAMKFGSVLVARIRIFRLKLVTADLMDFLWKVGLVNPAVFTAGQTVLLSMNNGIGTIIDLIGRLKEIPFIFIAHRRIKKLYRILFGHYPHTPRKPGDVGLYDIYKRLSKGNVLQNMVRGSVAIKLMAGALNDLTKALSLLGLALPLILASWLAVKILNPITKSLSRIFRRLGRHTKSIIKGSWVLMFMAGSLSLFIASMVLVGITAVLGYKFIGVALLVLVGLVGIFVLLGTIRPLIKQGYKAIKYIALAIALLGLVAITMALTGMFIAVNWKAFLLFAAYMTMLVGVFFVLAFATKKIQKGAKTILLISLCVSILALVVMLMALIGQYIQVNWEAMAVMVIALGALVGAVVAIGLLHKKIEKGAGAVVLIVAFSLAMVIVMGAIAAIAALGDPLKMLEVTGIMILIVIGLGAAAFVAGQLQQDIMKGLPAMLILGLIASIMATVMMKIAAAASIADPLEMLAVVGIMTLLIIAVGALAISAGALLAGPQAAIFALGIVAIGMIAGICAAIAGVGVAIAAAAKAIDSIGYNDPKELAAVLNLPFAALIRGDENGESVFTILKDLPGVITMAKLVAKIGMLAMIMGETGLIANVLQHIASLNMPDPEAGYDDKGNPKGWKQMQADDFAKASMNTSVILGMTAAMFGDEEREFTLGDGSRFKVQVVDTAAIDKIGYMTRIKVKRLAKIVGYVGSMADVLQHIASLNMPDPEKGYDENGKPLGWKQMQGPDFATAASNAGTILSFFADLFADKPVTRKILGQTVTIGMTNELAGIENISRSMKRRIKRLGEIVGVVGNMANTLQNIASLNMPDPTAGYTEDGRPKNWISMGETAFTNATENAKKILTTLLEVVASDDLATKLDNLSKKSAQNFKNIMEPMGQISGVVELIQSMASGEYVKTWKDDPDNPGQRIPATFGTFDELLTQKAQIEKNITSLFSIVIGSIAKFETDSSYKAMRKGAKTAVSDVSEIVTSVKDPIEAMIEIYNTGLAGLDAADMTQKYNTVSSNMKKILDDISGINVRKDIAAQMEKNLKQTTALFTTVSKTDVNKLRSAADLMKNIANLARSIHGDFDGLARVINEQLLTALEEFRDELRKINEEGITVNGGKRDDNVGDTLTDNRNPKVTNPDGKVDKGSQQQQLDNRKKKLEEAVNDILKILKNASTTPDSPSNTIKIS